MNDLIMFIHVLNNDSITFLSEIESLTYIKELPF